MRRGEVAHRGIENNKSEQEKNEAVVQETERLVTEFKTFFTQMGLLEIDSVPISSDIDPSVRFVGSHVNVFKTFFEDKDLPEEGVFIAQDCVRTRNVKKLLDDEFFPKWGSYFKSLGVLLPADRLSDITKMSIDFLVNSLGVSKEDILIRVSAEDKDLLSSARDALGDAAIEVDSRESKYYRHTIGKENVTGRNFNIALKGENNEFEDIGNVILLDRDGEPHSVELALGVSTIVKETQKLDHVLDATPIEGLKDIDGITPEQERKLQDCIIFAVLLFQEGLRPIGSRNKNRILKKYTHALSYFRLQLGLDLEGVSRLISSAPNNVADSDIAHTASIVVEYLRCYENELKNKKMLGKDDKKILELLNSK